MLKAIKIGSLKTESNVFLAPMTGISDQAFRNVVSEYGAGLVFSEMIASQAMIRETRQSMRMAKAHRTNVMAVQLAGCEPEVMAEAAKLNADLGAQMIDINMGCPVKKVVNGHAGSALMRDLKLATSILEATVKAVNLPVTLKMRTGWNDQSRNAPELAKIAEKSGIKMITVHGRTRCQLYNGKSDWQFIQQVKASVNIPVIGNGDVVSVEDAKTLLEQSKADGVMIGRGSYGRPWFINQVQEFLKNGLKAVDPTLGEKKQTVLKHFDAILNLYGVEAGVKVARKHLGWYSKGFHQAADFRVKVNQTECPKIILNLINNLYE